MGGEYSFLEGMTKAANPYLQGAMKEGWRRKSEDKATAEAIKRTQDSRRFQLNRDLAGTGTAPEGAFAGSEFSKELGGINTAQRDTAEIEKARKIANDRNVNLKRAFDMLPGVEKLMNGSLPTPTKVNGMNMFVSVLKSAGVEGLTKWDNSKMINYEESLKTTYEEIGASASQAVTNLGEAYTKNNPSVEMARERWRLLDEKWGKIEATTKNSGLKKQIAGIRVHGKMVFDAYEKKKQGEVKKQNDLDIAQRKSDIILDRKKQVAGLKTGTLNINTPKFKKDVVSILKETKPDEWTDAKPEKKKLMMLMETINQMKQFHGDSVAINETESGITEFIKDGKIIGRWR